MCHSCDHTSDVTLQSRLHVQGPKVVGPFVLGTRFQYTPPAGTISEAGREAIRHFIHRLTPKHNEEWQQANLDPITKLPNSIVMSIYDLPRLPEDWDWVLTVTRKGSKYGVGKFAKRVEKFMKDTAGVKCPAKFLTEIGNIAADSANALTTYNFDFVDDIDWNSGAFGDAGSCWWGVYHKARKTLTDAGGLAIRFFREFEGDDGYGRAWIAPFEDKYVVFNGYGFPGDSTRIISRMLADHFGFSYQKVEISNHNSLLYLNNDSGYLIGPHDVVKDYALVSLKIGPKRISCANCGDTMHDGDQMTTPDGQEMCQRCFDRRWGRCNGCINQGVSRLFDRQTLVQDSSGNYYCPDCAPNYGVRCEHCNRFHAKDQSFVHDGKLYCPSCRDHNFYRCADCETYVPQRDFHVMRDPARPFRTRYVCSSCFTIHIKEQEQENNHDSDDTEFE
jgi:hypothetical protein